MGRSRIIHAVIAVTLLIGLAVTWMSSYAQSGDISYGQKVSGTLKIGGQDTWHFLGNPRDLVDITITPTSGDLQPVFAVQDSTKQVISRTPATASQSTAFLSN